MYPQRRYQIHQNSRGSGALKKLEVQTYPADVLRKKTRAVKRFGPELARLAEQMFDVMYNTDGVGLAAPQIGIPKRIVVIDSRQSPDEKMVLVNPSIVRKKGEEIAQEGCLSLPGAFSDVKRAIRVEVAAQDVTGKDIWFSADGFLARIIQHEIDHLDGFLFIDRLDVMTREQVLADWKQVRGEPSETAAL